jgi:hypothetical protein
VRPKIGLRVISARRGVFRVTAGAEKVHLRRRNLSARFSARLPRRTQRVRIFVPQTPGYLRATRRFALIRP